MKLTLENQLVTLRDLRAVWREETTVSLGDDARRRIAEAQEFIDDVVAHGDEVYGVNTGFGQLAQVHISDDELVHLQNNLVRSHAVGVGEDLDDDVVRLIMFMKVVALGELGQVGLYRVGKFNDARQKVGRSTKTLFARPCLWLPDDFVQPAGRIAV